WNVKAEGSGDLGSEYRFNYSDNYGYNVAADDLPHTFTNTAIINIVGKGQAATLQQKVVIHTTINANGEPTSSVDWFELTCR
ncbi:MAG TPA: hypothetical protein VE173_16775, partial [Longimicrobiales bacterium]|nr:hypothetical protein [Longimicrobiales bacterium]